MKISKKNIDIIELIIFPLIAATISYGLQLNFFLVNIIIFWPTVYLFISERSEIYQKIGSFLRPHSYPCRHHRRLCGSYYQAMDCTGNDFPFKAVWRSPDRRYIAGLFQFLYRYYVLPTFS